MCCGDTGRAFVAPDVVADGASSVIVSLEIGAGGTAVVPANLQGGTVVRVVTPSTNSGAITLVEGRVTLGPGVDAAVSLPCPGQAGGTVGDFITLFLAGV